MVHNWITKQACTKAKDVRIQGKQVREDLIREINNERDLNDAFVLPTTIDRNDIFDPEGRGYRRRVEATPEWNRPLLPPFPAAEADGRWMSRATEMMDALPRGLFAFRRGYQAAGQAGRPFRPPYSYAKVSHKEWDAELGKILEESSQGGKIKRRCER